MEENQPINKGIAGEVKIENAEEVIFKTDDEIKPEVTEETKPEVAEKTKLKVTEEIKSENTGEARLETVDEVKTETTEAKTGEIDTSIDIPGYIKQGNEESRNNIVKNLGLQDHERHVFEVFCDIAREAANNNDNYIYYDDAVKKIVEYGRNNLIREIYTDVNAQMQSKIIIKKLNDSGYCKIERGSLDNPVSFILTTPRAEKNEKGEEREDASREKQEDLKKDMYKDIIERLLKEAIESTKPFPDEEKIDEIIKRENYQAKIDNVNIEKSFIKVDCSEFNEKFIQEHIEAGKKDIIQVAFQDSSNILLLSNYLNNVLTDILFPKIMEYINTDRNIVEKMKVVYAKKRRSIPPIESVFENQVSEASFFWISTFYEIMTDENERLQEKTRHFRHRLMFQIASMLYYYALFKRELLMKADSIKKQQEIDSKQVEKILINDYVNPLTIMQLLFFKEI